MKRYLFQATERIQDGLSSLRDKVQNNEVRTLTLQSFPFWCASVVAGLVAVLYSSVFRWIEQMHESIDFLYNPWVFLFTPLAFLGSWWIVKRFSPEASGSGIPQLMAAIELSKKPRQKKKVNRFLSLRVVLTKIASSIVMILGGGAIGREGPTIQVSGSIFNAVNNVIPDYWPRINRRLMLVSGGAAGLAAAFNTPLGGIVFAIEELGKTHLTAIRTHLFTAVIIGGLTTQLILGSYLYLGTPDVPSMKAFGIMHVIIAAVTAGGCGHLISSYIYRLIQWKKRFRTPSANVMWVLSLGVIFAALIFFTGNDSVGSGKTVMADILFTSGSSVDWFTFPSRFLGTILAYVCGGAGGVFAPSLAIGSTLGDSLVVLFQIHELKNLIVIVGMIGFMTGVTHSPFTSFILVLEMTNGQSAVFPMMLAAVISFVVARSLNDKSLYDQLAEDYFTTAEGPQSSSKEIEENRESPPENPDDTDPQNPGGHNSSDNKDDDESANTGQDGRKPDG